MIVKRPLAPLTTALPPALSSVVPSPHLMDTVKSLAAQFGSVSVKVARVKDAKTLTVSVPVPGVVKGQPETGRHLVLFAQEGGLGKVLAIESKPIS